MSTLNLHHLRLFRAVAREGTLTGAARALNLSQSAVSTQIKSLEAALGHDLFERRGRNLVLSEDGRLALRYADEIFGLGREFLGALRGQGAFVEHRLKIAATHVVPKLLVREIVEPVVRRFPAARIGFFEGLIDDLIAGLATHDFDVVISDTPLPPGSSVRAFNHHVLASPIVWLGGAQLVTPAVRRRFPACLDELPLLLPSRASAMRRTLDDWFAREQLVPSPRYEFDDTALLKVFAEHEHGVFPVPLAIAATAKKQPRSKRLALLEETVSFYAISPERRVRNPMLLEMLKQAGQAELGLQDT